MAGSGFTPPSDCDKDTIHGNRTKLWDVAQLTPDRAHQGYVFLGGDIFFNFDKKTNKLLVPKIRITGIECPKVLGTTLPNYWQAAWDEAEKNFGKNVDILLGINSFDGRTQDQLHIHMTGLHREVRTYLDSLDSKSLILSNWNSNIFVLKIPKDTYVYRVAHVDNLSTNAFDLLEQYVSKPYSDRFAQSLAIVRGPKGNGYLLIATQGKATQQGQPAHIPDLKVYDKQSTTTYYGTSTVEPLMDRNWK
ncbi:CDP-diacylglycerol diphosphatase [Mycolicibacterium sp.]|uniref:CDP-diacylglycerol diphosphatase n=1 Tax=Mycolicibacterium sp. TaxID=2320850 RepID=UPI0028A8A872|nr:CDP-diacylglycerol diphosphatase [Mycolicibacterium sp.]